MIERKPHNTLVGLCLLTFVGLLLLSACGETQQQEAGRQSFATGWIVNETEHIRLLDPPDSPRAPYSKTFSEQCEAMYGQLSRVMSVSITQKIEIYRFVTSQACEDATGHPVGHVEDFRVYTRIGAPIGGAMALAACTSIDTEAKSFPLIRHGLRKAFDNQATDIHRDAHALEGEGRWLSLSQLLSGDAVEDREAYDLESASFVGYLIQRHGIDKFKMLWRSVLELQPSLEKIYGGGIEQLEEDWITHVEHESKKT